MEATLGIDIAKATFVACLVTQLRSETREFTNNQPGFRKLNLWLKQRQIVSARVCMEYTNRYWEALAEFLFKNNHRVSVVNAYRTAAYWKSEHLRAKTDYVDAAMLARFCTAQTLRLWSPPTAQERQFRALVRELEYLKGERAKLRIRLEHGSGFALRRVAGLLTKEIARLQSHVVKTIRSQPPLLRNFRNLQSIPGVGPVTAMIMLAEIGDKVHQLDSSELAAYAGLAPRIYESGTSVRKNKGTGNAGNHRVKRAFYLPAIAAIRTSPFWKAFLDRFVARGKPKMVAIGAIMRKLFLIACGVLKSQTTYDPSRCGQPA